jgi:hypothetical protein
MPLIDEAALLVKAFLKHSSWRIKELKKLKCKNTTI